jgi:hypothetical protein
MSKRTHDYLSKPLKSVVRAFRPLKIASVKFASKVDIGTYEGMMAYSILETVFQEIYSIPIFKKREQLWDECIEKQVGNSAKLTYVEFGVHEGYSIKYFAQKNLNKESIFIGLDSFEGLPEDWGTMPKGTFDTKGVIPKIDDSRISFIKGLFQDTWNELYRQLASLASADMLVVHYDADLYSSTLLSLSNIDSLKKSYIAIFDEFTGHETRALYNYSQAFNASVSFIAKTVMETKYPSQVMCRITPHST